LLNLRNDAFQNKILTGETIMRIVIVGGVAGGASAAARARRLSESATITIFERGKYISFANCGLPYFIGGDIKEQGSLLVTSPEMLKNRFNIDVQTEKEVTSINPIAKTIAVKDLKTGVDYTVGYDKLILSPGAAPIKPQLEGIGLPGIHVLRDIPDMERIHALINKPKLRVTIVGGGYIGLEMAEALIHRGCDVRLVEATAQVMPPLDPEMAAFLHTELSSHGVMLLRNVSVTGFTKEKDVITINLSNGKKMLSDLVVLAVGVRPETALAQSARLRLGPTGAIAVNSQMRTSDPDIYAVGDACEVINLPLAGPARIPLAGPANRQGRIAADAIFGKKTAFRGTQGTSIVRLFTITAGMTGANEKQLKQAGIDYEKVYIHPMNHASYYPGAKPLHLKLLFNKKDGKVLGAQIVGQEGADKRIDVLSMAIQASMTVYDLEEAELAYAPPFGSAKDPVNFAGFVAANTLRGDAPICHTDSIPGKAFLLDVRTEKEHESGCIPGSYLIPVDELRSRLSEVPEKSIIVAYCKVGLRGYIAQRILMDNGFTCLNLSGGFTTYSLVDNPKKA